jgi:DNA-binding winged helix-turn-helix (wHTH) protein/Tol biopolymer transport system component
MQNAGQTRTNSDNGPHKLLYEFGAFQVDPHARLLLRDGRPVPLTGKAFDILLVLLKSHGEVVTKDDLIARVWPDTVVEEGNLGRNISRLRKALDESPDEHRYIVTLARCGYRFVPDVRERWEENGVAADPAEIKPFPAPDPGPPPSAGFRPRRWLGWSMVAFVALLALLASVIAGYRWTRGRARYALEPVQRQLTANPTDNWVIGAAISPDGRYLAFQDRTGLYLRAIDSGETHAVSLPPEWRGRYVTGMRWFPDGGKLIASVGASECFDIWAITVVAQATPRFIRRCGFWSAVSPDGRRMAFQNGELDRVRGKELWVSGINGESPWKLLTAEDGEIALSPVWSPDGRWIAYLRGPAAGVNGGFARTAAIEIRPAGGGSARTLVPGSGLPESTTLFCMNGRGCLSWSPDGRLFFTASGPSETDLTHTKHSIWAVPVELRKGEAGEPVRLAQWADFYPDCLTLTADGKRLAFVKGRLQWDVYVSELGRDGRSLKRTRRLTRDSRGFGSGPDAWTRDGRILFSSDRNGKLEVFSQGLNENLPQAVVRVPGDEQHDARLSPDGSWILYVDSLYSASRADSPPQRLMRLPVAGGSPELVLQMPASARFDYRCPLKAGACVLSEHQGNEVLFYPLDPVRGKGDRLLGRRVLPVGQFSWDVSPDGSRVAAVDSHKRVLTLSDGSWHELPLEERWGDPGSIAWTADGKGFLVTSANSDLLHVTTAGKVQLLTHNDFSQELEHPVPSPDGRYLAFQVQTYDFNAWMIENP